VHPVSEVNAIESPEKDKFPDGGLIGVVVRQADESFDMRASVSTASGAIGEPGDTEESKDKFSYIVYDEVPKAPVDVPADCLTQGEQQVLNSETYSHELADTCVEDKATFVKELPCDYTT